MSGLNLVSIRYADRQLILENPLNDDIDLRIEQGQLIYESHIYEDVVITDDQLLIEANVSEAIFEIHDNQLWFYNPYDDDIDFYLEDGQLIATSNGTYTDAFIRSNQCFIVLGIELDMDDLDPAVVNNIHDALKASFRQTFGLVKIFYYNPLLEDTNACTASSEGTGSSLPDVLRDNDRGWISGGISDAAGYVDETLTINISKRLLGAFTITTGDDITKYIQEASVTITNGTDSVTRNIVNYNDTVIFVDTDTIIVDANQVIIHVTRMNTSGIPVFINYVDIQQPIIYDKAQLLGIDLLEELTYLNNDAHLGAISANEINVYLNNELHSFDFNNPASRVSQQLKKNRKIIPYLGIVAQDPETEQNTLYWVPCGVFWAYNWNVKQDSPMASVQGFDTLWLLSKIEFKEHYVQRNVTLAELLEYVLSSAQRFVNDLEYYIDPDLQNVSFTIPIATIDKDYFFNILQNISACYPIDIYCTRSCKIACMLQTHVTNFDVVDWSDSDMVVKTEYPTLYTDNYNIITVKIYDAAEYTGEILKNEEPITINGELTVSLTFSGSCTNTLANPPSFNIDKTANVNTDSTHWYDWGCEITFSGTGTVNSIIVTGSAVNFNTKTYARSKDEAAIIEDGELELIIDSKYIQKYEDAKALADLLLRQSQALKYNAQTNNRGDFLITLNDRILLSDGIATDNNYKVITQDLKWDGGLTGSTKLITDMNINRR